MAAADCIAAVMLVLMSSCRLTLAGGYCSGSKSRPCPITES